MKTILYIFRNKQAGFSIEGLFTKLAAAIRAKHYVKVTEVYMPYLAVSSRTVWENLRFTYRQQADLYHITGEVHYLALALPPARTILTIHDCVSLERQHTAGNTIRFKVIYFLFYYLPIHRAGYVTTISEKSRQELIRFIGPKLVEKVRVIPNHYNPDFKPSPRPFNNQNPRILHVGTGANKNLPRLIDALQGVCCTLVIIGRLSLLQKEQLTQSGLFYIQRENLSNSEVIKEYEACDIVSFVSTYEGFGLPIIEANAVGRVVLTSSLSPMRELAGSAAHLVDPHCVDSIHSGILHLINDPVYREQLILAGYQNAAKYTIENVSAQYAALYQEVLAHQDQAL